MKIIAIRLGVGLLTACLILWAQEGTRSAWDGVFTTGQASRGSQEYQQRCASCHGTTLTGGESAPPLTGGEFSSNWNSFTVGDLFERIRTTMPADRVGSLNRAQNADILAYILSMNEYPAGQDELASRTEILKTIRLEAKPDSKK
jgi:S-disulfanyl-L-cysteine oxidoreductase SoxD